jgi:hypothetical protein
MGEIMRDPGAGTGIGTGHDTDALGNYGQVPGYSWRR